MYELKKMGLDIDLGSINNLARYLDKTRDGIIKVQDLQQAFKIEKCLMLWEASGQIYHQMSADLDTIMSDY